MSTTTSRGSEAVYPLYCQPCSGEGKHLEAVGYCVDCEEHLCSTCFKYHLVPKPTKHHRLKDETEMPKKMKSKPSTPQCTDVCPSHPNKVIEYFCRNHNQLGCSVCTTLNHRSCDNIDYIPDVADKVDDSQELKDLRWRLEVLCNTIEKIKEVSKENKITAETYRKNVKAEITKLTRAFTTLMTKLEQDIERKIDSITDQDLQLMDDTAQECDAASAETRDLTKDLDTKKQNGQHCQLFVAMKKTEEAVKEMERKTKSLSSKNRIQRYHFTPDSKWQDMVAAASGIGTISVWRNSCIKALYVQDIDVNIPDDADKNKFHISGGVMVNDKYLAVCNTKSSAVELIDVEQNKMVSAVILTSPPACITEVNTNQVIVTLPAESKLHFLSVSGDTLEDTDHDIPVDGPCFGIVSTQHHLIVGFMRSFKIEILDMNGTVVRRFDSSTDGDPEENFFACLSISPCHDIIYVSNPATNQVVSLTLDGKVLDTYTDARLEVPTVVVTDMYGNAIVCGYGLNNVHVISSDIKKIKVLLEGDKVAGPVFMCTNKSADKLFIYMFCARKIRVYKLF